MYNVVELLSRLFKKSEEENTLLNDRIEFRINKKEKVLIVKYCELRNVDRSKFLRDIAIKEIDNFINNSK